MGGGGGGWWWWWVVVVGGGGSRWWWWVVVAVDGGGPNQENKLDTISCVCAGVSNIFNPCMMVKVYSNEHPSSRELCIEFEKSAMRM